MTRSRKDGAHGGGHRQKRNGGYEVWSKRCDRVNMWSIKRNRGSRRSSYKTITHRCERRVAKREIFQQLQAA